jgi:hypothetical protein
VVTDAAAIAVGAIVAVGFLFLLTFHSHINEMGER